MRTYPIGNGMLTARISGQFAALMDALQFQGANRDGLLELDDHGWEELLNICDMAHLTLTLAQLPSPGFPEWVVARLDKNMADNAVRWKRIQATYTEAAGALRMARVPHVVLKGFTLATDYAPDPRFRMQSDVDLFCPPEFIDSAVAALIEIGYTPMENQNCRVADHVPALMRMGGAWRGNMYDPDLPVGIEIHFCLWNESLSQIPVPEANLFWNRRIERRFGDFAFRSLNAVDQLGYFALHLLRDVFSGDWIVHHVYELAAFLDRRASDDAFWAEWHNAHSERLRALEALAFLLAQAWFSPRLSRAARAETEALPLPQRRWVERLGGCPLEVIFRRAKEGRLLQFVLAESLESKANAVRRALLPATLAIPRGPALRVRNRRQGASRPGSQLVDTLGFLAHRLQTNLRATANLVAHGLALYLPQ